MRISFGSDERNAVTDCVAGELRRRGHEVILHGAPAAEPSQWADVAHLVALDVAGEAAEQGVLFCWTGTGVSIAANKVAGVRAALCADAETARGARAWNDANVLCLSLRTTTEALAKEILDAWFLTTGVDPAERENIDKLLSMERTGAPSSGGALLPSDR